MKKLGVNSVFRRLLHRFLLLIALTFTVILLLMLAFARSQWKSEISRQINRVSSSAVIMEQQLQAVSNLEQDLFSDLRLQELANGLYQDNYERGKMVLELQSSIARASSMNSIIEDIVLSFPGQNFCVSAGHGYKPRVFSPDMFGIADYKKAGRLFCRDGELCMMLAFPLLQVYEEENIPDYEIQITLSEDYLQSYISQYSSERAAGAFWAFGTGEDAVLLYPEEDASLMTAWSEKWRSQGCPQELCVSSRAGRSRVQFVSQSVPEYGLTLVTYRNAGELMRSFALWITGIFAILAFMFFTVSLLIQWASKRVRKPVYQIMDATQKVQAGDLSVRIYHEANDEFSTIYDAFNDTVQKTADLMEHTKEQAILLQKAEQLQLQSQINPHFLYNSFYNIKFMAQNEDYEQIDAMVTALAKYYRFLNKETEETVSLETEAAHMANYITVQQMRFGDKISVDIEPVPAALSRFKVPKLILQPVVENAYNYGLKNVLSDGHLSVRYDVDGSRLGILIEDNGGNMDEQKIDTMRAQLSAKGGDAANHALNNINRRLRLSFGEGSGVFLAINEAGGLAVTLQINTEGENV